MYGFGVRYTGMTLAVDVAVITSGPYRQDLLTIRRNADHEHMCKSRSVFFTYMRDVTKMAVLYISPNYLVYFLFFLSYGRRNKDHKIIAKCTTFSCRQVFDSFIL
jgi:hypothetical protein